MQHHWNTESYIKEVEHGSDTVLLQYQKEELAFIRDSITSPQQKTLIDIGAGYGRVVPHLAPVSKRFIAVEQDAPLLEELARRIAKYENAEMVVGSGDDLVSLINHPPNPVLLSLQNTLGPWHGDRDIALSQIRTVLEETRGEAIISLFCREALRDWGLPMYKTVTGLLGAYDPVRSDIDNGCFRSDTGYESRWFSLGEREDLISGLGGRLKHELRRHQYHVFHISYS